MPHSLPDLPYDYAALEPHIDERTMRIHHDKHHAGYVAKLNTALEGHADLAALSVETLIGDLSKVPEAVRTAVRNNGGGHANHSLFWSVMAPGGPAAPTGDLADAISTTFGSVDAFKSEFAGACGSRFGSGWGWLSVGANGALIVESTANQDSPLMEGRVPILGCDVWEHAYYLNYQNRRPDYVSAWWNVVNWAVVAERFQAAR